MFATRILIACLLLSAHFSAWPAPPGSLQARNKQLQTALNDKIGDALGGKLGLCLHSLKYNRTEISLNAEGFFTPASCLKLLVTAAALHYLPLNTFPETSVELLGKLKDKSLEGQIHVVGGGDPNISDRYFKDAQQILSAWADSIHAFGIDTLYGDVTTDHSLFQGPFKPVVWKKSHFNKWYGAEISALSYNDNCFNLEISPAEQPYDTVRTKIIPDAGYINVANHAVTLPGSKKNLQFILHPDTNLVIITGTMGIDAGIVKSVFPVRNPPAYFKGAFRKALAEKLTLLPSRSSPGTDGQKQLKVFSFTTVPLINVIEDINQRSQNLHAEMLLRHIGLKYSGKGSRKAGLEAEKEFLRTLGLKPGHFKIYDGSGLSRKNRVRVKSLMTLLARMARHPRSADYIQSLVTPGVHGAKAVRNNHLEEIFKFKTGYIHQVQGLCGYIFSSDGDTLALSLFLNGYKKPPKSASSYLDTLATFLANWYNKERQALAETAKLYCDNNLPKTYLDRLVYLSKALEGRPYFEGPTGEGRLGLIDTNPLINLSRFDCVTYIESIMALAGASNSSALIPLIKKIRYENGKVSYLTRKHFFVEDWVKKSPGFVKIFRFPGDTTLTRTTGKIKFFTEKNLKGPEKDPTTELSYMPYDKALQLMDNWHFGKLFLGVGFITRLSWLWVSHTGFLDATGGGSPLLRHASSSAKKVVSENFKTYLLRQKSQCQGVFFFEFENRDLL